ncbi:MAG TPA: NAD-glutamate dehydrogenase [Nocardioides sp.]|uniref:NAD-glutamate dehydrogenase n=1 Tax=Nocardioides sp. TaxID=35761 RepID=UPI002ED9E328
MTTRLLEPYFRHVPAEELAGRDPDDLAGAVASHERLAAVRPVGTARVRVSTPSQAEAGWSAGGRSVVEVVVDDMPYLVDSVTMELSRQRRDVHLVVHPTVDARRDLEGRLEEVQPVRDGSRPAPAGMVRESWMHVEIGRVDPAEEAELVAALEGVLDDVRGAVEDAGKMRERLARVAADLRERPQAVPPGRDPEDWAAEVARSAELLTWLTEEHFLFLGCREYELQTGEDEADDGPPAYLRPVPGTGYGILRADPSLAPGAGRLPERVRAKATEPHVLVLTKANSRATVHRPAYLDYVGVKAFDAEGRVVGERRFLGLFTNAAFTESVTRIPVLREKAAAVLARSGYDPASHAGKVLLETLEIMPREELFSVPVDELGPLVETAMAARERRTLRVVARPDAYGRYVSVLVSLPRDRYSTAVRERFARILRERLGGGEVDFTVRITESTTARVHFVVHAGEQGLASVDPAAVAALEQRLTEAARSWRDDLVVAVEQAYGEQRGSGLARYLDAFPAGYQEDFPARVAAADLGRLEAVAEQAGEAGEAVDLALYAADGGDADFGGPRFKIYRVGGPLSLSRVLPMLTSMGAEVVDERPYDLEGLPRPTYVYDFGLRLPAGAEDLGEDLSEDLRERFGATVRAMWDARAEIDGFNALVVTAGLEWREAALLRAYASYLRQAGTPFAQATIEAALRENVVIARSLVELFHERFDPDRPDEGRADREAAVVARVTEALEAVASLDQDRILRSYLLLLQATLRTNWFAQERASIALKIDSAAVPDLPDPRPRYEIFVHAPSVEGVHLRFGSVARGGLRWSDRRDDFRTEVLGLVKAQMVKNTVIVPVGAKGGFVPKRLPDPAVDRDGWLAAGKAAYRTFISGLLDLTDNREADGTVVPPPRVVRHDEDDPYLVVAADKGTATFSDLANSIAQEYGFWLGDAFASGGSAGYDHKAMGITARGAWVSTERHFRERGQDSQTQDFTCVGVGDMSGDVFGNGMLLSRHVRLVAAFDHRDIFLDPTPDAATSYAERERLFALPRSSWQDYDRSLISPGGGVWSRQQKSIPLSAEARDALGLAEDVASLSPHELIRAILRAPADLLFNGGIGTYVKGTHETHAAVGDKANDAVRVNGRELRAAAVVEGGNLGLTQAGRVEYALGGGRINTDFIDNSAGVDTSDREVNLKILLGGAVAAGELSGAERDDLLASMTDEVAAQVLHDNREQNLALANALSNAPSLLHVHEDWMSELERRGVLSRAVEGLPDPEEVRRRLDAGGALTAPELSVLMAWTKIELANELVEGDLPDDPYLEQDLRLYFPSAVRERFAERIAAHPLRREIVVTQVVNDLVNGAGMTFWPRLAQETGATAEELVRANFVAREIFGSQPFREEVRSLDHRVDAAVQTRMRVEMRTLVERASRWLIANRRALDAQATVDAFAGPVQAVMAELPALMVGREQATYLARLERLLKAGVPEPLAGRAAVLSPAYLLLGVVDTALSASLDPAEVARVHVALGERLGLPVLLDRIVALPRNDRWQSMARAAIREELHGAHHALTAQVLARTAPSDSAPARIAAWEEADAVLVARATETLEQICADEDADLARLSVGLRVVRGLLG